MPYGIASQSGQVNFDEVMAILALARSSGIDILDTAIAYGESEACLGKAGTEPFKVITKLPAIPENVSDVGNWIRDQMQTSLLRLRRQAVYGVLLHQSQQLVGPKSKALVLALEQLKAEGVVNKIGVSIYSPMELDAVIKACKIDLVQAPFNLVDQRIHSSGWLQKLYDDGVEVHARSVFLQGLLLMPRTSIPNKFEHWSDIWSIWHGWLTAHSVSAVNACIGFVQAFPQVSRLVVGVESVRQLRQLVVAAKLPLSVSLPSLSCDDELLINPSRWNAL